MRTKIMACSCDHSFQDKKYGKRRRVWNMMGNNNGWRCSVCEKEQKT